MESCIVILAYISSHYFELLSFFLILRQKSKKITNCFQWVIKNKWSKCWDCSDMFVLVFTSFRPSFGRPLASARDRTLCGFLSPSYSLIKKTPFGVSLIGRNEGIRTLGPYVPNVVLYQAELHSVLFCKCFLYLFLFFVKLILLLFYKKV